MKIAFFNYSAQMGGAEHSLLLLLRHINREKYKPVFISTEQGPLIDEINKIEIQSFYLPFECEVELLQRQRILKMILTHPWMIPKLYRWLVLFKQFLIDQSITCIHANQPKSHILALLAKPKNILCVLHLRDIFKKYSLPWFFYWLFFPNKNAFALAVSQATLNSFPKRIRRKGRVIYNGTTLPAFSKQQENIRGSLNLDPKTRIILSMGRLVPWKGFDLLLEAFLLVSEKQADTCLVILGDTLYWNDDHKGTLIQKAKLMGLEARVFFPGFKKNISDYLFACDFFILPSVNEPFGRVLIEAMSHEKPTIAFRTGGIPEIVLPHETGLLVDKRNPLALANAMEWMLLHPQEAKIMGQKGKRRVETIFSIDKNVREIENFFDSIKSK